jgi:hypothetical protein
MKEHLIKKLDIIKKSAELLLTHYESKGFKNTLFEVGLKNILNMSQEAIAEIEKEKASEPPVE